MNTDKIMGSGCPSGGPKYWLRKGGAVRTNRAVACLLIIAAFAASMFAGDRNHHDFRLQLFPSQNATQPGVATWKAGAPVFVLVTMINNSKRVVHYSLTNPAWDYEIDLRDASGNPVRETERLRKLKEDLKNGPIINRNILGTLKPHETAQDTIEVSIFMI